MFVIVQKKEVRDGRFVNDFEGAIEGRLPLLLCSDTDCFAVRRSLSAIFICFSSLAVRVAIILFKAFSNVSTFHLINHFR